MEDESLNYLDLSRTKIERVPLSSFLCMTGITSLQLRDCIHLVSLPTDVCKLKYLERLDLSNCSNFIIFPEITEPMEQLQCLNLSGTKIKELPSSFGNLVVLKDLQLSGCSYLKKLPSSVGNLVELEELELFGCTSLESLPTDICKLKSLERLDLSNCSNFIIFPEITEPMEQLQCLNLSGTKIKELPSSFGNLVVLKDLQLSGCSYLKKLPSSVGNLVELEELKLSECTSLESLPTDICKLKSLKRLDLSECSSFKKFPEIADPMEQLQFLDLEETEIEELPSSVGNLVGLKNLQLSGCSYLKKLPPFFENLVGFEDLNLSFCRRLEFLPNNFCNLKVLKQLSLGGCVELKELPPSFTSCSLKYLDLSSCEFFEEIHDLSTSFPALEELDLSETMIQKIPPNIKQVSGLKFLKVKRCKWLRSLPELRCVLEELNATECTRLETVANSVTADTQGLDQMFSSKSRMYHSFGGCVNLNISSRIHIMDDALLMVTAFVSLSLSLILLKMFLQSRSMDLQQRREDDNVRKVMVTCPRDEIPKWFTVRKEGSSLNVELPQHWCNGNLLAIALCSISAIPIYVECLSECEMILKTNNGETTHSLTFRSRWFSHNVEIDNVVVYGRVHKIPDEAKGSVEASFHFYTNVEFVERLNNVKRCGVCFLNAQAQAQAHDVALESPQEVATTTKRRHYF